MPLSPQITITPDTITTKSFDITAVTYTSSTATYTATAHTFAVGDIVLITEVAPDGYNGTFTITAIATNTFTVANTTNTAVTTATGNAFWASATNYDLGRYSAIYNTDSVDLATVQTTADGKNKIYSQTSAPTASAIGDYWIDTDDYNKPYRWDGSAWQVVQDGTIAIAQSTANTAITNAATAYSTGVAAQSTANTALSNAATAYTTAQNSLQPSAYAIQNPTTKQLTSIDATGLTVYSGSSATSGARVVLNSTGLAGYNSSGSATFSVSASTGAAVFSGSVTGATITASTMNIGGNAIIDSSGYLTATGATITGTITSSSATITGGSFTVGSAFQIATSGFLTATGAQIGPWYFGSGYISSITGGGGNYWSASSGALSTTNIYVTGGSGTTISMSGGNLSTGGGNISTGSGNLTSTGTVTATTLTSNGALNVSGLATLSGGESVTGTSALSTVTVSNTLTSTGDIYAQQAISSSTSAATNCYITTTGQIRKTSTTSSRRYKENITDIFSVAELNPKALLNLPVRAFTYKEGHIPATDDRAGIMLPGFIAEEMDAVYPIAVDYENGVETWNSFYLVPALLALIQDQEARIKILEGK
jgi:hypothetical protein